MCKLNHFLALALCLLHDLEKHVGADLLVDARLGEVVAENIGGVNRHVGEHLDLGSVLKTDVNLVDAGALNLARILFGYLSSVLKHDLAGNGAYRGTRQRLSEYTVCDGKLFIVFVPADGGEIVTLWIEEQIVYKYLGAFNNRRLARTKLLVYLLESLLTDARVVLNGKSDGLVLVKRRRKLYLVSEHIAKLGFGLDSERVDKHGHGDLAVLIDAHIENIVCIRLVFKPCAAVRDHRSGVGVLAGFVDIRRIVDSGRANDLRNDNALRSVYNESSLVRHYGKITHEYLGLLDFARQLIRETHIDLERRRIVCVAFLALLNGIFYFGFVNGKGYKVDKEISRIINDRGNILENLLNSFFHEPSV